MKDENNIDTHLWADHESREVKIDGRFLNLFSCSRCGREFACEADHSACKAVRVGPFHVEFLDEAVSRLWVAEPCPGRPEAEHNA